MEGSLLRARVLVKLGRKCTAVTVSQGTFSEFCSLLKSELGALGGTNTPLDSFGFYTVVKDGSTRMAVLDVFQTVQRALQPGQDTKAILTAHYQSCYDHASRTVQLLARDMSLVKDAPEAEAGAAAVSVEVS